MTDSRIDTILEHIQRLAVGDLSYRGLTAGTQDEFDAAITGLNMLAEELESKTDHDSRSQSFRRDAIDLFERAPVMLCSIDLESGSVLVANEMLIRRHGPSVAAVVGAPLVDFVADDARPAFDLALATLRAGVPIDNHTIVFVDRDDRRYVALFGGNPVDGGPDAPKRARCTILDIEERRALEQQLRQAQKMEAIGRLAGGVAHDFNNLVTVIQSQVELAMLDLRETGRPSRDLEEALAAAIQAAELARQLLAFARKPHLHPRVVSMNEVILASRRVLERGLGESHELVLDLAPELWSVRIDPNQLGQVLLNLTVNASDAMTSSGTVTIATRNVTETGLGVGLGDPTDRPVGEFVELAMTDTGIGMAAPVRERVFEPFFTTKTAEQGSGLGLATSDGIVRQAGGHIHVTSEPGVGSTFVVRLPRAALPPAVDLPAVDDGLPPGGKETILLLEDNEMVRRTISRMLESAGYRVLAFGRGVEAVAAVESGSEVDLMLCDVVLPGMTGPEVAGRIVERHPGLRVLYMSGYTDQALDADSGAVQFIHKPFRPTELLRRVRDLLDER